MKRKRSSNSWRPSRARNQSKDNKFKSLKDSEGMQRYVNKRYQTPGWGSQQKKQVSRWAQSNEGPIHLNASCTFVCIGRVPSFFAIGPMAIWSHWHVAFFWTLSEFSRPVCAIRCQRDSCCKDFARAESAAFDQCEFKLESIEKREKTRCLVKQVPSSQKRWLTIIDALIYAQPWQFRALFENVQVEFVHKARRFETQKGQNSYSAVAISVAYARKKEPMRSSVKRLSFETRLRKLQMRRRERERESAGAASGIQLHSENEKRLKEGMLQQELW